MGNPRYTPSSSDSSEHAAICAGFWWRVDLADKVLLFGRDPVGSVSFDVRLRTSKEPWVAHASTGHAEHRHFVSEAEAIAFVEAAMPAYLAFREYRRLNPPAPGHSTPSSRL